MTIPLEVLLVAPGRVEIDGFGATVPVLEAHFIRPGHTVTVDGHFTFWDNYGQHYLAVGADGEPYVASKPPPF